jgi:very-short-patch-repair endonuclease
VSKEKELINTNIDLKKNKTLEILLQKNNISELIKEVKACKEYVDTLIEINDDVQYLKESADIYKGSFATAGINDDSFNSLYENKLTDISGLEFEKLLRFITLEQKLRDEFNGIKDLNYGERTKQIENIVTMQMTYLMDERFVEFTNTYKADAKALKQVIKAKKKFPKEQFSKLKSAFPCILAGIRDYAEYIPLEPEIFDLVIIDEASQVSIAQAFPALLRAKKVVVLGDNLQFSNVKSALARGDINKQHLANLKEVFLKNISTEADKIARLEKFNIKVSILDFFGFINNYQTRLVKHFRGYRELISYSNKYFYKDSLQVMKVRGVPVSSVIKFTQVKHDGLEEIDKNTNNPEIDFIISELKTLKEQEKKCSVGVITPHTNQQQLLYKKISDLPEADYFFDELKLKIMTFDTCQGEEMDIIFYSMVATETDDKLNYVFISNLNNIDIDDDEGKIKAQRLNVGLSRAKECMHFVISKPIDQYVGTAKEFLQHYSNVLLDGQKEVDSTKVDKKSGMEPLILNWFYQTKFWTENKETAEILPQFELGKYLKQLDKNYKHPNYRVDFLLVYDDNEGIQHKIIIEYDGFLEHFGDSSGIVNKLNFEEYYSPEDVYRQHVLEGYGYRFIRINKFNLGKNPIEILDCRIQEVVKKN